MDHNRYINFLAKLSVDSAHPGGRRLSDGLIRDALIHADDHVLDVGCGTGATAALLAEETGAAVTGIDLHPKMVERALERAAQSKHAFRVLKGSVESLPFEDASFDWIVSESVTAFTDIKKSVPEYYRVLRPGKRLAAIEMTIEQPLPEQDSEVIKKLYGVPELYTVEDWRNIWKEAGFTQVEVLKESDFSLNPGQDELPTYNLTGDLDEEAFEVWLDHMQALQIYKNVLSYRIYRVTKPVTEA
ncbi:class I SAM-dependent methyltransferase [Sporolactobacillus pectinivorans]|uniref:class I SAM-dependent methyltransferase n=1 Tax=Sporolactobacillus pectinivorans TaxID=1591408 RepID=UPI000C25A079|nr:class I SAM-dependent methyltransferase [Sporolactobacillus pectinivorans]